MPRHDKSSFTVLVTAGRSSEFGILGPASVKEWTRGSFNLHLRDHLVRRPTVYRVKSHSCPRCAPAEPSKNSIFSKVGERQEVGAWNWPLTGRCPRYAISADLSGSVCTRYCFSGKCDSWPATHCQRPSR